MSASAEKINKLFWLAYANEIKLAAKPDLGASKTFFLATQAQQGPPGGSTIPEEYTNQGIYDLANNLLSTDDLFYTPSAEHGYAQALRTFMNYVDLGQNLTSFTATQLYNAQAAANAAAEGVRAAGTQAHELYEEQSKDGLIPEGMSMPDWIAAGNAPQYQAALQAQQAAAADLTNCQQSLFGPMAATWNIDNQKLGNAFDTMAFHPGYNMKAAVGNVPSPQQLTTLALSHTSIPTPTNIQYLPDYKAPEYASFIENFEGKDANAGYNPKSSIGPFVIDVGKDSNDYDFGQTSWTAGASATWEGWLSFSASVDHKDTTTTVSTGQDGQGISVKITYDDLALININPGSWNIDTSGYTLRAGALPKSQTLSRVDQILVISNMGYVITVDAATASDIDTKMTSTTSGGGSVSIFGISVGLGGGGSSTKTNNTHTVTWDKASCTLTVVPSPQAGVATVVGVVGEKITIHEAS